MPRRDINAVLLAVYLWMFTILRVAWTFVPEYSTPVLGVAAFTILALSLLYTKRWINNASVAAIALLALVGATILLDMLFRYNSIQGQRLYEFAIYAVMPVLLLSQVRDLSLFLRTYTALSVLVFFLYVADPLSHYFLSQSYMVYGFQAMLPAFFGLHLGARRTGHRLYMALEIVALVMMLLFGNRMAGIAGVFFLVAYEVGLGRLSRTKLVAYPAVAVLAATLVANVEGIVARVSDFLVERGYSSYALNAALMYLGGSMSSLSAEREVLWASALVMVERRPVLGYGLGYFEKTHGIYVHNFVMELAISYGVVGLVPYLLGLLNGVAQIVRSREELRTIGILLLVMSFPKLLTSVYIFVEPSFWMLIYYGLYAPYHRKVAARQGVKVAMARA